MNYNITEPTIEECSENRILFEDEFSIIRALWYPQMGGICG